MFWGRWCHSLLCSLCGLWGSSGANTTSDMEGEVGCLLSVGTGAWKKEQNCVSQTEWPQKNWKAYTSAGPCLLLDPKSAIMWVLGKKKKNNSFFIVD